MDAIAKSLADADRSYHAAKASVADVTNDLLARGPPGVPIQRTDLSKASEQLRHFTGWVYAAVRPIAHRIAGQPIRVAKVGSPRSSKASASFKPLESHEILRLLADPNDLMVGWSLMFSTVASLELTGRQLWWLPKRQQVFPIPTSWIQGFDGATKFTAFKVRPPQSTQPINLPADECCYFSYPNPADPHGAVSPLQAVGGAVDSDEAIQTSQLSMFQRGIHPSHVLRVGKDAAGVRPRLTPAQHRQIIGAIQKRYSGVTKAGEPLILDNLIEDVFKLSHSPSEMDYLDSGKQTKARIAQGFGTNPIIMGEIENANRASATVASQQFCDYTINPKIELLSQCLTEYLGRMFGGGLKIWIEPAIANDSEMQLRWAETLAKHGVIRADELRRLSPFDLREDNAFDGLLVGGRNMTTTHPLEQAIGEMVTDRLGSVGADAILSQAQSRSRNGEATSLRPI